MTATDGLRPAVALLAEIVSTFPDLPAPAITLHQEPGLGISVQLQQACDLEAWGAALGVNPEFFLLHVYASAVWTEATAIVGGVRVQLYSDVPVAPVFAMVSPAEDARRQECPLAREDARCCRCPPFRLQMDRRHRDGHARL